MESAIEAEGLEKTYPKGVKALDGLSFAVAPGSVFALLGPNGAGKSTAVKVLTTLARPDSGRATVAGLDVIDRPDLVRRTIGVVAQGSGVDIQATGRENLRLQGQIHGIRGREIEARAQELLERFGLAEAADRVARGVQRRHAAAARHRHGARPRPGRAVPRRADHRPRPRGARRHVGRDREAVRGARQDRAAHHPLSRGGRPARRAGGDRRPRHGGDRGNARGAQARAARRRDPRRPRARRRTAPSTRR